MPILMPNRNQPGACLVATAKELWRTLFQAAFGLLLFPLISVAADSAESKGKLTREYDLKAVFLINLAQIVEWPSQSCPDDKTTFTICVLGEDPFGKSLDEIVEKETVHERRILIRHCKTLQDITDCQILFISRSEASRLSEIFQFVDGKGVLTVGDTDGFSTHGGMIGFVIVQNRLQVKINLVAAK